MYLKGQKLGVALHPLHREYKNVQKYVLTNVNMQRTGKTFFQFFAFSIFDGSHVCRFYILLRKVDFAWESRLPLTFLLPVYMATFL